MLLKETPPVVGRIPTAPTLSHVHPLPKYPLSRGRQPGTAPTTSGALLPPSLFSLLLPSTLGPGQDQLTISPGENTASKSSDCTYMSAVTSAGPSLRSLQDCPSYRSSPKHYGLLSSPFSTSHLRETCGCCTWGLSLLLAAAIRTRPGPGSSGWFKASCPSAGLELQEPRG